MYIFPESGTFFSIVFNGGSQKDRIKILFRLLLSFRMNFQRLFILIEINSLNRIKDNYLIALIFLFLFVCTKN